MNIVSTQPSKNSKSTLHTYMRSFREFFNEAARLPFAGGTQHTGHFDLPDLKNLQTPDERPHGGWSSLSQIARAGTQAHQMHFSNAYIERDTLEKFRALAENVMSAIELKAFQATAGYTNNNTGHQKNYDHAQFDQQTMTITGLTYEEIVGGDYPRLRHEEMKRGEQLGILYPNRNNPKFWTIDINKLRFQMEHMKEILHGLERKYRGIQTGVDIASKIGNALISPTNSLPDFTQAS